MKHMIWRASGGEAAAKAVHFVGRSKTAIWLHKYCFPQVLDTFPRMGFCKPRVRPQELKPHKTHDLEGLRRRGCSKGGALLGEVTQRFGIKLYGFASVLGTFAKLGFVRSLSN